MREPGEYERLRQRPAGRAAMAQQWRDLLFLHFSTEPEAIQPLLPQGLTIDTFPDESGKERAWIGLVPFCMHGVRPLWSPNIPGCHAFPETNVRTYVHRDGKEPGVWFFSLEASNAFACRYARRFFSLPYHPAKMSVIRTADRVEYSSHRRRADAFMECSYRVADRLPAPLLGSLDFFLIERYLLYANRGGNLFTGQVHHVPYPLHAVTDLSCTENLCQAAGIEPGEWEHLVFSPGVDVEVFALRGM